MRRILPLAAVTLFGLPGTAMALDVNGCPTSGSIVFQEAFDSKSATVGYDDLFAQGGDVARCTYSFGLNDGAAPGTITVYSADFRGSMFLTNDDETSVSVEHNGTSDDVPFTGPRDNLEADYTFSTVVATHDGKVTTTGIVDMSGATGGEDDLGSIDAADYAEIGRITLPTDESSIIAHLGGSATLLTSAQPISEDNSISFFGGIGSAMLGANGQYNLGQGFSLLGGAALIEQGYSTVGVQGVIGSLAVRYVEPGLSTFRPFAEGGATLGGLGLTFTDPGKTTTTAGLASVYARGGVETALDSQTTATLSASLEESLLGVGGYDLSTKSFSATLAGQSGRFTVAKAEASIHHQFTDTIDASASAGVGVLFAHDVVTANIGGLGNVTQAPPSQLFVDYGARLGWAFAPSSKLEGFVQGSTTTDLGTHVQVGAAFTQKF